jgi:N-acetylglucosaminyl-diphospho-decaprenol L-rhamnosyltransferase
LTARRDTGREGSGLAIATVTYNSIAPLREFFGGITRVAAELGAPVVAIDNASTDGSVEYLEGWRDGITPVVHRNERNRGYAAAVNQAFAAAPGPDVLLVNPDVSVTEAGAVEEMRVFLAARPKAAVVAPRLLEADGSVQSSARVFPTVPAMAGHATWVRHLGVGRAAARRYLEPPPGGEPSRIDWAIGAALLIRRAAFDEVGGWDERFFLYLEDTDFCMRCARAGWETWYLPSVSMRHTHPRESDPSQGSVLRSPARRHHVASAIRFFGRYPRLAFRSL